MTNYGMPYFLEDKTGLLTGSDFVDIYDRMRLSMRQSARDSTHTAYMIYDTTSSSSSCAYSDPKFALDFGSNNSLGTVSFGAQAGHLSMKSYLSKLSALTSSKTRRFRASDGQDYQWNRRIRGDQEWTCTNSNGYLVAYYSLKVPDEPEYNESSGCMLTLDEAYPHLAIEMLATLMIMRHIVAYNL